MKAFKDHKCIHSHNLSNKEEEPVFLEAALKPKIDKACHNFEKILLNKHLLTFMTVNNFAKAQTQ
jgi:hypothetical protein